MNTANQILNTAKKEHPAGFDFMAWVDAVHHDEVKEMDGQVFPEWVVFNDGSRFEFKDGKAIAQ